MTTLSHIIFLLMIYYIQGQVFSKAFMTSISIKQKDYEYECVGDCNNNKPFNTHPGIVLIGGNTTQKVDDAFKQLIHWSDGGNFLIIRASNTSYDYIPYVTSLGGSQSVASLTIHNINGANSDFVVEKINEAQCIFISGGNVSKYCQDWATNDTLLQSSIQNAINRNIPIGGTSAGSMMLSTYIYKFADQAAVVTNDACNNPYNTRMQFNKYFVKQNENMLDNVIIDPHFKTQDRLGRLIAFMARIKSDTKQKNIRGIGITERTAIIIDLKTKVGIIAGYSDVFVLTVNHDPLICEPMKPITYKDVHIEKLSVNDKYDFIKWKRIDGKYKLRYTVSVINGQLTSLDPYCDFCKKKREKERKQLHIKVIIVMVLCLVVTLIAMLLYFRKQLIIRQLQKETQCTETDNTEHLVTDTLKGKGE